MAEKSVRYARQERTPVVVSLELQNDQIRGALITETGRVLALRTHPVKQTTVRQTVTTINHLILELSASPERQDTEIKAVGISLAGIVDHQSERVSFTNHDSFNWERVPLAAMIEETLTTSGIDIRFAHNTAPHREARTDSTHSIIGVYSSRDAQVVAEAWCGAAIGKDNVVLLNLEVPISAGIIANKKLIHGAGDLAGAAGFLALSESHKSEYQAYGAFGFEASEAALVRRTLEQWKADSDSLLSQLTLTDPSQLTVATILRAARSGDALALSVVEESCLWVARAIASIISLLNPEIVLLGGSFGLKLKPFLSSIRREVKQYAHPPAIRQCQIKSAKLGDQAILLGAARLAWIRVG